jgi:hypothetical protein
VTITEFLLARIAEDEEMARGVEDDLNGLHLYGCSLPWGPCDCGQPARVLADCEALRRIVAEHQIESDPRWTVSPRYLVGPSLDYGCKICSSDEDGYVIRTGACVTLKALAWVYADHQDYREEWK